MTIPLDVVGPSAKLGVYKYEEAKHTPLYTVDNNVAHSNFEVGMKIKKKLERKRQKFRNENLIAHANRSIFMKLHSVVSIRAWRMFV